MPHDELCVGMCDICLMRPQCVECVLCLMMNFVLGCAIYASLGLNVLNVYHMPDGPRCLKINVLYFEMGLLT